MKSLILSQNTLYLQQIVGLKYYFDRNIVLSTKILYKGMTNCREAVVDKIRAKLRVSSFSAVSASSVGLKWELDSKMTFYLLSIPYIVYLRNTYIKTYLVFFSLFHDEKEGF